MTEAQRTVLFVCPHGAGKSRVAAAWFNSCAPPGWWATSAGIEPQRSVSEHAPRLLQGTAAADQLDTSLPRNLSDVSEPAVIVAIDCPASDLQHPTERWQLEHSEFDDAMRKEIAERVERLAHDLQADSRDG